MYVKDLGIICRRTPYSETSWILKVLTPMHGMVSFIAKGARRPKSTLAGKTEVFTVANFQWYDSGKGDLHTLSEVALVERPDLSESLEAIAYGNVISEFLIRIHSDPRPDQELFELLLKACQYLNDKAKAGAQGDKQKIDPKFLSRFFLKVAEVEGHKIQTQQCAECGERLNESVGLFSKESGAFICSNCYPVTREGENLNSLFTFVSQSKIDFDFKQLNYIEKSLLEYLSFHFEREIHLKSIKFLNEIRGN